MVIMREEGNLRLDSAVGFTPIGEVVAFREVTEVVVEALLLPL